MLVIDPQTHFARGHAQGKSILLVGRPGHLRDALMSLLCTLPDLGLIETAENGPLALGCPRKSHPDLLIAGGLSEAETHDLLLKTKVTWPNTPTLVLTENARQVKRVEQAGATRVLPARTPSRQLLLEITHLIQP